MPAKYGYHGYKAWRASAIKVERSPLREACSPYTRKVVRLMIKISQVEKDDTVHLKVDCRSDQECFKLMEQHFNAAKQTPVLRKNHH